VDFGRFTGKGEQEGRKRAQALLNPRKKPAGPLKKEKSSDQAVVEGLCHG